jgi:hypothetical protein
MDQRAHRRFLDYLELVPVFPNPDRPKLDQESFAELDAEYQALRAAEKSGELSAEGLRRLAAVRRVLLRD